MKCLRYSHLLVVAAGGMLEAFSIVRLQNVFVNVQPANLLLCVLSFVQGDWEKAVLHLTSVAAYIIGIMLCCWISRWINIGKWRIGSLILTDALLLVTVLVSVSWVQIFLLALLCGFYYEDLCSTMERWRVDTPRLEHALFLAFGTGALAGAALVSMMVNYVLAIAGIILIPYVVLQNRNDAGVGENT